MLLNTARRRRVRAVFRGSLAAPRAPACASGVDQPEPPRSALGQQTADLARREGPNEGEQQRVLASVLAALRQLTSGAA